jgi:hypothetical protein
MNLCNHKGSNHRNTSRATNRDTTNNTTVTKFMMNVMILGFLMTLENWAVGERPDLWALLCQVLLHSGYGWIAGIC